jgi:hypothetical protein
MKFLVIVVKLMQGLPEKAFGYEISGNIDVCDA